jgi:membrane protease YdiL (CAAX protease family)
VFGKFTWRTAIASVVPIVAIVFGYLLAAAFGMLTVTGEVNPMVVIIELIVACMLAVGEEFGFRGFLLPHLRQTRGFWSSNLIVAAVWWALRIPIILLGFYGAKDIAIDQALIGYTLNIVLLSLVIGAFWELHNDVWAPVITHGAWIVVVATTLPAIYAGSPPWLLTEFGMLAAVPLAITLGVLLVILRLRSAKALVASD